ncbi:unnamed protein product [Spirodela intermedia]|uniref:Nudix hydrolase domain-containing protein n=1 Tax=Spirodela intermedia TaxID=51605 RepID=A0A7I8J1J1_SPIIN|nr:unnamed protein product [Spirodela intermedia]CAA6663190.1 unnamed protein product [Spirodela intermedia]
MSDLVARTGRHQQRYEGGYRLVAGCIPYKYRNPDENCGGKMKKTVEVLMINSSSGPGLLFPKGGWENDETVEEAAEREALEEAGVRGEIKDLLGHYYFKSRTLKDEFCPDGSCKAAMFPLLVKEELCSWPEQTETQCRHSWMQDALVEGFSKWHAKNTADNC